MKKSTKGAVAAAAAGVLLLGGAGTLANWTASITGTGGTFTAGHMYLETLNCNGNYVLTATPTHPVSLVTSATRFVPGDKITSKCVVKIHATGANLEADVTGSGGDLTPAPPVGYVTSTTVFHFDNQLGPIATHITSADDGRDLYAINTVQFDPNAPNNSQDQSITVNPFVLTLTQQPGA